MQHKCRVTVIDKKCFSDLQNEYLANPSSGPCPFYNVGDEFIFERYGGEDTFWYTGRGSQCGEAWDCISRYIYTALQGGSIMRGWTNDERMMIACCNGGTRPVLFKIERLDYIVVRIEGMSCQKCADKISAALEAIPGVKHVQVLLDKGWAEVYPKASAIIYDASLIDAVESAGQYTVDRID